MRARFVGLDASEAAGGRRRCSPLTKARTLLAICGLLLEVDGFRFVALNDCDTSLTELPGDIDLLSAQYSGAMWYPNCYEYRPEVMQQKVARVRADLDTLIRKCRTTQTKACIPSAGPSYFLDPELMHFNDVLIMSPRVLRAVLDGRIDWEEALLSLRVRLRRVPDVFDSRFMGLLRYGNEPVQTLQMAWEAERFEMIEKDGLRLQRFCPHAGEDLTNATICGDVIECPRHHWKWNIRTGTCIEGGSLPLRIGASAARVMRVSFVSLNRF